MTEQKLICIGSNVTVKTLNGPRAGRILNVTIGVERSFYHIGIPGQGVDKFAADLVTADPGSEMMILKSLSN
jgi:hypothetical protein